MPGSGVVQRDRLVGNLLERIDQLERRLKMIEAALPGRAGTGQNEVAYFDGDGELHADLTTETLAIVDAGSAGATEQDWIAVEVGNVTGYLRVYAAK